MEEGQVLFPPQEAVAEETATLAATRARTEVTRAPETVAVVLSLVAQQEAHKVLRRSSSLVESALRRVTELQVRLPPQVYREYQGEPAHPLVGHKQNPI